MEVLKDSASEIALLSSVAQHGKQAYLDVADLVTSQSFSLHTNKHMYTVLSHIYNNNIDAKIDYHLLLASAKDLNLLEEITENKSYLERILTFPVEKDNTREFARRLRVLQETNGLIHELNDAVISLKSVTGAEAMSAIVAKAEEPIFSFINKLTIAGNNQVEQIGIGLDEYLEEKENNPVDVIGVPTCYPIWQEITGGIAEGVHIVTARPKAGKAQPLDSIIQTTNGEILNKYIKVGDKVFTDNGDIASVTHIHPQGIRNVYKLTFKDGDTVECDENHLWKIKNRRWKDYKVLSLKDILNTKIKESDRYKWQIPLPQPVNYEYKFTTIDPYIMGLLLGDGSFRGGIKFTTKDQELVDYINNHLNDGYSCKKTKSKYSYLITKGRTGKTNKYIQYIKKLGLYNKRSNDKFIPDIYLYNSYINRLALLQGLMDTDGYEKKRSFEYSTVSKKLSEQVKWLVNSIGGICTIKQRRTRYTRKDGSKSKWFDSFRLIIKINNNINLFTLSRKINNIQTRIKPDLKRVIEKIEYIGQKECQCITIDSDNGLYLTNNFIVTHNSTFGVNVALYVAYKEKIPVLYLDTELNKRSGTWDRMIARLATVPFFDVRRGKYVDNEVFRSRVHKAKNVLKKIPLDYVNITGKDFDEVMSIVRRWIVQKVGYDNKGRTKPCLLVYDYLKLTKSTEVGQLKEYEAIGYRMSGLHDLTNQYSFPCLTFCQLNREFDVSQSDRIRWFCTSMCSLQKKTEEEIAQDGRENGNRKLVPEDFRFGPGLDDGDYINFQLDGKFSSLKEMQTRNQLGAVRNENQLEPDAVDQDF